MAGLTDAGFEIKRLDEINTEIEEALHGNVSPGLNLSSTSALGQFKGATASEIAEVWEALQALWASWDRGQATGAALDRIGALTGSRRRPATRSTVVATVDLSAGTYAAESLVASVVGEPLSRFTNAEDVTAVGGTQSVTLTAQDTGPVRAAAGQLTVISNPITGFNSVTNPADAVLGSNAESNAEFRRRQELELALKGSTTADAIRADLLQKLDASGLPLFDFVSVVENDTDATVDSRPPHSFESMVVGGTNAQVAAAILSVKPVGIKAYGSTTLTVYDSQTNPHVVGWTRPTNVLINIDVEVDVIAGAYAGAEAVKAAIVEYAESYQSVGYDVIHAQLVRVVASVAGVVDAHVFIYTDITTPLEQNFVIGVRELAQIADARIDVSPTVVPGSP